MNITHPGYHCSRCQPRSSLEQLEKRAVQLGDDPETGMFAAWRKMQQDIKAESGYDGKREQCIRTLCEHGGYRKAALKLHPDRNQGKPEEERQQLQNTLVFLGACKELQDDSGQPLTLDDAADREKHCKDQVVV